MTLNLFRLKSNPKTIIKKKGEFHSVFWSAMMESGFDARWMIGRFLPENSEELTKKEKEEVLKKVARFDKRYEGIWRPK